MLDEIIEKTSLELGIRKKKIPEELFDLEGSTRSLKESIKRSKKAIITEIKPASPSEGSLRKVDAAALAKEMESAGSCAISVLTEPFYFHGSLSNLRKAKDSSKLPVMRKDFILDQYQLKEAKHYGADAVLLMVSVLGDRTEDFYLACKGLGMEAIVEVHDEEELEIAVSANAAIIGINNRNLADLSIDLGTTEKLSSKLPKGILIVSESGIRTKEELDYVLSYSDCALIGSSIMRGGDVKMKIKELLG